MKKPKLEGVKNLLFDLGGVIMDIRRENCVKALEQLEVSGIGEMLGVYCQQGAFLQLEGHLFNGVLVCDNSKRKET